MPLHRAPIRLMVVEDVADVREALEVLLGGHAGLEVVESCATAAAALAAVRSGAAIDVALVDLGLPDASGEVLIGELRRMRPSLEVVVLTVFEDRERLLAAFRAGAIGYLLKDTPPEGIVRAVFEVVDGGAPMSPRIARRIVSELQLGPLDHPLSPREMEVLRLLTRGVTYADIGHALGVAASTVRTHIKSIYRKLDVSSKAEATAEAFRLRLTD